MSGIANAKAGMGWVAANARPACGNCGQVRVEHPDRRSPDLRCVSGFLTSRYAICDQYVAMTLTGSEPK